MQESVDGYELEERMSMAQTILRLSLSLRKKVNIKVRQPLQKILVPVQSDRMKQQIENDKELIKNEVNIKEIEYLAADNGFIKKENKTKFCFAW